MKYFDVNDLYASIIEENQNIKEEHLLSDKGINKSYFINDYYKNVENTILDH